MASGTRRLIASWHRASGYAVPDFPWTTPTRLPQDDHRLGFHSLPRPPIGQMIPTWYRNINLLSIDYAFRPRLRPRLTLSRRTLLRNPRSEEHTSELQSRLHLVCRLLLE